MDIDLLSRMVKEIILEKDRVVLPGLGTFVAEMVPSSFSDRGYTINPPYRRLYFRPRLENDTTLAEFYASSNHISPDMADRILTDFISDLKQVLQEKKTVVFPGLGRLRATKENNFFFVPDEDLDIFPEGFGLAPVSLKSHQETKEEVAAAVENLRSIMEEGDAPVPDTTGRDTADQDVSVQDKPADDVQEAGHSAGTVPAAGQKAGKKYHIVKIILMIFGAAVLLVILYVILNLLFPGLFDGLLYNPAQLEILDYVAE